MKGPKHCLYNKADKDMKLHNFVYDDTAFDKFKEINFITNEMWFVF